MKTKKRNFYRGVKIFAMTASILGVASSRPGLHGQAAGGSITVTTAKLTATGVPPSSSPPAFVPVKLLTARLIATGVTPPSSPPFTPLILVTPKLTATGKGRLP
jgi:hypothetical protein